MIEGLLWLDDSPKRDIADKIQQAAARYREKFGQQPNLCYVHTSMIDGVTRLNGIQVVPAHNTLKHHFWIGVE